MESVKKDYFFENIEVLRALAIVMVLISHFETKGFSEYNYWLWTGVDLFFFISGFLITSLWNLRGDEPRSFYIKRFFRIIPAYLVVLFIYAFIEIKIQKQDMDLWKYLTFSQNLFGEHQFFHSWSLCVEEHFYLLFPLFISVFNRYPFLLLLIFLSQPLVRLLIAQSNPETLIDKTLYESLIYMPTYARLEGISLGVFFGVLYTKRRELFNKLISYSKTWLFVLLINFIYLALSIHLRDTTYHLVTVYSSVTLFFTALFILTMKIRSNMLLKTISELSYSAYLIHHLAQYFLTVFYLKILKLDQLVLDSYGLIFFFIYIISVLIGAKVVNLLVEKPFINLSRRLLNK